MMMKDEDSATEWGAWDGCDLNSACNGLSDLGGVEGGWEWSVWRVNKSTRTRQVLVTQRLIVETLGIPRHVTERRVAVAGKHQEKETRFTDFDLESNGKLWTKQTIENYLHTRHFFSRQRYACEVARQLSQVNFSTSKTSEKIEKIMLPKKPHSLLFFFDGGCSEKLSVRDPDCAGVGHMLMTKQLCKGHLSN
jgi:hypothetical protein